MASYTSRRSNKRALKPVDRSKFTMKLSNLPKNLSESKLERFIKLKGVQYGMTSCRVFTEERYALVNYSTKPQCDYACSLLNGCKIDGVNVIAKIKGATSCASPFTVTPPIPTTVKINHLSRRVSEDDLKSICTKFGNVTSVKVNVNYAYVNFDDCESAERAIEYLNSGVELGGQTVAAKIHSNSSDTTAAVLKPQCIPVQSIGVPHYTGPQVHQPSAKGIAAGTESCTVKVECEGKLSEDDLFHYFSGFGKVEGKPKIRSGTPDYAYINFSTADEAIKACQKGVIVLKGIKLAIKRSNKPKPQEVDTYTFMSDDVVVHQQMESSVDELKSKLAMFDVSVSFSLAKGMTLVGNKDDVAKAKDFLQLLVATIAMKIVEQFETFHCCAIPVFANPKVFENLQQKHHVEWLVLRQDGSKEKTTAFCAIIARYLKAPTPLKANLFESYFANQIGAKVFSSWSFKDDSKRYTEMSPEDSHVIETYYQSYLKDSRRVPPLKHTIGQFEYMYDFHGTIMTQTNQSTGKRRKIKRNEEKIVSKGITLLCRGLDVSAAISELKATVESSCVNVVMDETYSEALASEYCVRVHRLPSGKLQLGGEQNYLNQVSIDLKASVSQATMAKASTGPYWEQQTHEIELKDVSCVSTEWSEIETRMKKTLPAAKLHRIQRIQNKWLWEKYAFCRERMCQKNVKSGCNEMKLFHGTGDTSPDMIYLSEHGFDFRFGSSGLWGKGAYFASNASYSNSYASHSASGYKQMFVALVLTGDSASLPQNSSLDKPPLKKGSSQERYDSVNGQSGLTKIYIVYDHDKSYPAYLISYT